MMQDQSTTGSPWAAVSLIVLGGFCVFPAPTLAQQEAPGPDDPTTDAWMRIGPVFLTPTFRLQDVGVDDNVLNDEEMPEQDFTATMHSGLDVGIRLGRAYLIGRTTSDLVYFRRASDQRSTNRLLSMQFALPLRRFRSSVTVDTNSTRERPNNEIDVRAQREVNGATAHLDIVLAARTELTMDVHHETLTYAEGETFRGISLKETLDRTTDRGMLGLKYALTPLTDLTIGFEVQEDRFPEDTSGRFTFRRDASSVAVKPLLEFSPDALIRGSASVGYRRFTTSDVLVPDFAGVVAEVQVEYTLLGRTSFDLELTRDVRYSFEQFEPFYVSTGGRVSVIHRFVGPIELLASASRERLDYQAIVGFEDDERLDTVETIGGGFAVRLGERARFELKAELSDRQSNSERGKGFDRMRIFSGLNLEF